MSKQKAERASTQSSSYLLSRFSLLVILAALVLAAWYDQVVIVIVLALLLAATGLSLFWSRFSLVGVSCERTLGERRLFPGEYFDLKLHLSNRKLLPLPWIELDYEIPAGFAPDNALEPGSRPGFGLLIKTASLLWYTGVNWKQRLYADRRGYYRLGPAVFTSGDIFGFYPRSFTTSLVDHVIVYPRIFPIDRMGITPLYPIGETTAERRIFEDPVRVIGVRDYSPHDSLRHVHWKASARHQQLQVKVFEPTTTLTAALFLAVDSFHHDEPRDEELFELGISTAASVASHLIERHCAVGLFANSKLVDSSQPAEILPGSSAGQLVDILEALAKVTPEVSSPFEDFLQTGQAGFPWGTTLIFILSERSPSLDGLLMNLKESGRRLTVLQVGDASENSTENAFAWHNIVEPGDTISAASEEIA